MAPLSSPAAKRLKQVDHTMIVSFPLDASSGPGEVVFTKQSDGTVTIQITPEDYLCTLRRSDIHDLIRLLMEPGEVFGLTNVG